MDPEGVTTIFRSLRKREATISASVHEKSGVPVFNLLRCGSNLSAGDRAELATESCRCSNRPIRSLYALFEELSIISGSPEKSIGSSSQHRIVAIRQTLEPAPEELQYAGICMQDTGDRGSVRHALFVYS